MWLSSAIESKEAREEARAVAARAAARSPSPERDGGPRSTSPTLSPLGPSSSLSSMRSKGGLSTTSTRLPPGTITGEATQLMKKMMTAGGPYRCILTVKASKKAAVNAVSVVDAMHFVTADDAKQVKIWTADSPREPVGRLNGHLSFVTCLAVLDHQNGGIIVSGSHDKSIKVWDVPTRKCMSTLKLAGGKAISSLAIVRPRWQIASAGESNTVMVWDVKAQECAIELKGHRDWVRSVAKLGDWHLVSGSEDRTVKVWDYRTKHDIATLEGHTEAITSVATLGSTSTSLIASSGWDSMIKIWDPRTWKMVTTWQAHTSSVCNLIGYPARKPRALISCSSDATARVWDAKTFVLKSTLIGHTKSVYSAAVSAATQTVITAGADSMVKAWAPLITRDQLGESKIEESIVEPEVAPPTSDRGPPDSGRGLTRVESRPTSPLMMEATEMSILEAVEGSTKLDASLVSNANDPPGADHPDGDAEEVGETSMLEADALIDDTVDGTPRNETSGEGGEIKDVLEASVATAPDADDFF